MKSSDQTKRTARVVLAPLFAALLTMACASHPPLATVDRVDLDRYMGDWYVLANIPTPPEKGAVNAIESYERRDDGDVDITFTFYKKSLDGKFKEMNARGFVEQGSNGARWKVQFIWPLRFPFYVMELDPDYMYTVIGLPSRDYLWIMSRTPSLPDSTMESLYNRVAAAGYDTTRIKTVPQIWPEEPE
jgi:apolipoprotein D and lipocalin family protein